MLKLLTCVRGHFWESPDEPTPERPVSCPECGAPADTLPLFDLAPSGPALAQKVADRPLPLAQVIRLMELLARAVDHAHKKGLLHRNLRPSSVLLQPVEVPRNSPVRDEPTGAVCPLHSGSFIPKLTGF